MYVRTASEADEVLLTWVNLKFEFEKIFRTSESEVLETEFLIATVNMVRGLSMRLELDTWRYIPSINRNVRPFECGLVLLESR